MTNIEWTRGDDGSRGKTWNPTTGCDRVSPGCDGCYALTMAKRLKAMGSAKYQRDGDPRTSGPGFGLTVHPDTLTLPFRWRKQRVFVNSMSDLFHDSVPDEFIAQVFAVMAATPDNTYQVLTKRHGRMKSLLSRGTLGTTGFADMVENAMAAFTHAALDEWPLRNVWLGVSAETQQWADIRVPALLETPAAVRFISAEPLLGPVRLDPGWLVPAAIVCPPPGRGTDTETASALSEVLHAAVRHHADQTGQPRPAFVDWVIVGGESGPKARPMHTGWARKILRQCEAADVPYFFKQHGEFSPYQPMRREPSRPGGVGPDWDRRPDVWVEQATGRTVATEAEVPDTGSWKGMWRVGKKAAGRELDGRTWDEFPKAAA